MGKVRVKTLGLTESEDQDKQKEKVKKEQKKLRSASRRTAKAPGLKGGQRVVAVGPTEEELEQIEVPKEEVSPVRNAYSIADAGGKVSEVQEKETKKAKAHPQRKRSKRYKEALILIDRNRTYTLPEALELLKKVSAGWRIDGTVELHVNVQEKGISGQVTFPHSTGKTTRVAIADDKIIADIEKGGIDFEVLLASPSMMPKLAKVARILGPKGLMPNPKNGTISDDPEKLAASFAKGQVNFRTEAAAPIIHLTVGKVSMSGKDLEENIQTIFTAIGSNKIKNATLKSTMSPGIKIQID